VTVLLLLVVFTLGAAVGAAAVARNTHRIVARLPEPERVAFARKVRAAVKR
jgi:hypothetical protein